MFSPAADSDVAAAASDCGPIPPDLMQLYTLSNGLGVGPAEIVPVFSRDDLKRTWSSIQRLNSDRSPYLPSELALQRRFLLFALIGGPDFAAFDRSDGSIWFSEEGQLAQTDLALPEFVRILVKNTPNVRWQVA